MSDEPTAETLLDEARQWALVEAAELVVALLVAGQTVPRDLRLRLANEASRRRGTLTERASIREAVLR